MGEYIKYKRQEIKLGTCESLYYTTYADLEKALENAWPEERKEIAPYMDEKEGYLFRFPFADETPDFGGYDNCDRVFRVVIPRIFDTIKDVEYIHETIFTRKDDVPGFSYGFKSPCPASTSDLKIFDWGCHIRENLIFEIIHQKRVNGHLETVVRCPFCGACSRLPGDHWKLIDAIIQDPVNGYDEQTRENSARAMAGYLTKL